MEVARAQLKRDGRAARRAREPRTFTEHARASDVIRRLKWWLLCCECALTIMVAMVASASGYGTLRRFLSVPEGQHNVPEAGVVPSTSVAVSVRYYLPVVRNS